MMSGSIRGCAGSSDPGTTAQPTGLEFCPEALSKLARRLMRSRGFDLMSYKSKVLHRRLRTRLRANGCPDLDSYLQLLKNDPEEEEMLYKALIINVSSFFRNPETFWFLRDRVLPDLFARKRAPGRELVIVSAPCAEGEEPYSLAMLLKDFFAEEIKKVRARIVGIDIDAQAIERAGRGRYGHERLAGLPQDYQERFFTREGRHRTIAKDVRSLVEFVKGDLRQGFGMMAVDMIMCRNLLIYFRREHQLQIITALANGLDCGGYLVLGKTETMPAPARSWFQSVDLSEHVYQKAGVEPCGWR